MAQKSIGYVQLVWTCPNCGTKNPGALRACKNCGASMPKDVKFEQPIKEELVQDKEKIEAAKAGPDINCGYCGARNPATAKVCVNCGASLSEGEAREAGQVYAVREEPAPETIKCEVCGTENPISNLACSSCGSPLQTSHLPETAAQQAQPAGAGSGRKKGGVAGIGCALIAILLLIAAYFLFIKTDQATAIVTGTQWRTQVEILALMEKRGQDWQDSIPSYGTISSCSERVRRTSDNYIAGAEEVCGAPYMVDRGNGYSEKVQDCEYKVYDDYCTYTYQDWDVYDVKTAAGSDGTPRLPQVSLYGNQKQGGQSASYQIFLSSDSDTYTYTPSSLSEYQSFQKGDEYIIEVNALGSLVSLEKK